MATLYIDRRTTEIKLDNDVLICYEKGERLATIPLAPIDRLYLKGDISIQTSLLAKLGEKNIGVIFLQGRKNIPTLFFPQPHNDANRRIYQYYFAQNPAYCLQFSQQLIAQKLNAQQQMLMKWHNNFSNASLEALQMQIPQQTEIASVRGIEGRAAAIYFAELAQQLPAELGFERRNRRPPRDPFNALISLGYTLLYSEASLAIYGAGLDPYIGFYHQLDYGRASLACDLIEPFRPEIDDWIKQLFEQNIFKLEDFSQTNEGCLLNKAGRITFYTEFEKIAPQWRKKLTDQSYQLAAQLTEEK